MNDIQKFMARIDNQENLYGSAVEWLITCVIITITPTFATWLFRIISDEKEIPISEYLDDTLLIVIALSCSLLTLLYDKKKLIDIKYKRIAVPISWVFTIISGSYYFYLSGKDIFKNKYNTQTIIILLIIIAICSVIGFFCEHQHDKNYKELHRLIKKELDIKSKEITKLEEEINRER